MYLSEEEKKQLNNSGFAHRKNFLVVMAVCGVIVEKERSMLMLFLVRHH